MELRKQMKRKEQNPKVSTSFFLAKNQKTRKW